MSSLFIPCSIFLAQLNYFHAVLLKIEISKKDEENLRDMKLKNMDKTCLWHHHLWLILINFLQIAKPWHKNNDNDALDIVDFGVHDNDGIVCDGDVHRSK